MKIKVLIFALCALPLTLFAQNSGNTSSPSPEFVYAGITNGSGGVAAFKLDQNNGKLTEVAGSPAILNGMSSFGPLATAQGFVYTENLQSSTAGEMFQFQPNATTGSLTLVHAKNFRLASDEQMDQLFASPNGNNLYGIFQSSLTSFGLNHGLPSELGSVVVAQEQGSIWGFASDPAAPFAYAAVQSGNPFQGFQTPVVELLNVAANGNLTDSGAAVAQLPNVFVPGGQSGLAVDPTGHFLVVINGAQDDQLSVFAINSDGSLAEVPGSPFSTGSSQAVAVHFDPTGQHVYLLDGGQVSPFVEDMKVFAIDNASGALTAVQSINLPSGVQFRSLKVEANFVFLTNAPGSGIGGTITVFKRASSGQLKQAATLTTNEDLAETDTLLF